MKEWTGSARSNYVRVKDREAFIAWVNTLPDVEAKERAGSFALFVGMASDTGAWPDQRKDDDGEDVEIDIPKEIAVHLKPDEVFVYMECGANGLNYLTGWATAVNSAGATLHLSLSDIYERARKEWNCIPEVAEW